MISLIIKILIALLGVAAACFFWVIGLTNRSPKYVRTGWMIFLITGGIITAISVIEYLLNN